MLIFYYKKKYHSYVFIMLVFWFYQDSVDKLRNIFDRLELVMIGDAALRIRDAEAFRISCNIWDKNRDGYITPEEAAVTREITSSTFAGNTLIESFDEFKNLSYTTNNNSLFAGCSSLKSISVNGNMLYRMFYECISLEHVELGNTTNIGSEAFWGCSTLKRIELPDSLTTIDSSAFKGTGLVSIDIPSSVSSIGGDAFQGCPLETVVIRGYINCRYPGFL